MKAYHIMLVVKLLSRSIPARASGLAESHSVMSHGMNYGLYVQLSVSATRLAILEGNPPNFFVFFS